MTIINPAQHRPKQCRLHVQRFYPYFREMGPHFRIHRPDICVDGQGSYARDLHIMYLNGRWRYGREQLCKANSTRIGGTAR